jgi:methylmalonyl-CoA/ethylmalonyl-CoA epimerase
MNLSLHHVGVLVTDIKEAVLHYLRLGYEAKSEIVHDPTQTVYAQFLRLPGDDVYLELISPDRPDSKVGSALKKGGGLNHICYSTGNIDEECQRLCSAGLFLVSPPVPAIAFPGRRIAWLRGADRVLVELLERSPEGDPHGL